MTTKSVTKESASSLALAVPEKSSKMIPQKKGGIAFSSPTAHSGSRTVWFDWLD